MDNLSSKNTEVVQAIFSAFASADLPGIMAQLAPDVEWVMPGPTSIPFAGVWRGHEGVGQFFQTYLSAVEVTKFEVHSFIAAGDEVVVLGHEEGIGRKSGRPYVNPWAMVFTVQEGKVTGWHSYEETAALAEALGE